MSSDIIGTEQKQATEQQTEFDKFIEEFIEYIQQNNFIKDNDKKYIVDLIEKYKKKGFKTEDTQLLRLFNELIGADKQLDKIFEEILNPTNRFVNMEQLKTSTKKLYKELFRLQTNVIFDKLAQLMALIKLKNKNVSDLTRVLSSIANKTRKMNEIIEHEGDIDLPDLEMHPPIQQQEAKREAGIEQVRTGPSDTRFTKKTDMDALRILNQSHTPSEQKLPTVTVPDDQNPEAIARALLPEGSESFGPIQLGGGENQDKVIKLIYDYYNYFNILNSSTFLKLFTLLNNIDLYHNVLLELKLPPNKFKDTVFINVTKMQKELPIFFEEKESVENIIERDTKVFKNMTYTKISDKYIFILKLLHNINKIGISSSPDKLFTVKSFIILKPIFQICEEIISSKRLEQIYKEIYERSRIIDDWYNYFIQKINNVPTYLKIRKDGGGSKPSSGRIILKRYQLSKSDAQYAFINYKNGYKETINENYFIGPFNGIYGSSEDNSDIANKMTDVVDKLTNYKNVCMIGYGMSGSGKTSALIYADYNKKDGILIKICSLKKITDQFKRIEVRLCEMSTNYKTLNKPDDVDQTNYNLKYYKKKSMNYEAISSGETEDNRTFLFKQEMDLSNSQLVIWKYEKFGLGKFINEAFEKRIVEPSPNNPDSSRSHVVVDLKLISNGEKNVHFIICDLAGVEDKFDCMSNNEIQKFFDQYKASKKYGTKKIGFDTLKCENDPSYTTHQTKIKKQKEFTKQMEILNNRKNLLKGGACEDTLTFANPELDMTKSQLAKNNEAISESEKTILELEGQFKKFIKILIFISFFKNSGKTEFTSDNLVAEINKKNKYKRQFPITREDVNEYFEYFGPRKPGLTLPHIKQKTVRPIARQKSRRLTVKKEPVKIEPFLKGSLISGQKKVSISFGIGINDKPQKMQNSFEERIRPIKTHINGLLEQLKKHRNNIMIRQMIEYNCELRVNEGHVINRTLSDLRTDINQILKSSSYNGTVPLVFYNPQIPYCTNQNLDQNIYETFYKQIGKQKNMNLTGKISEVFDDFKIDKENIVYAIFTVVNISKNIIDPPKIPYMNLSELSYYYKKYINDATDKQKLGNKLLEILTKLANFIKQFPYYSVGYESKTETKIYLLLQNKHSIQDIPELIREIDVLNASTFIGSMEAMIKIKNLTDNTVHACTYINVPASHTIVEFINKQGEKEKASAIISKLETLDRTHLDFFET